MNFKRLEELETKNKNLALAISNAEASGSDDIFTLKKELYENKLEMIRLIQIKDKRNGITFDELDHRVNNAPMIPKYLTGVQPLDEALGGIETGTFIQFAGESYTGKTTLVIEILSNIAEAKKAVFFSFEMGEKRSRERIKENMRIDAQRKNLIIDFDTRNIDDLCNEIILYANEGVKFFAIDSKMKIEVPDIAEDYRKAAHTSSRLSKLTQQNDIIIILINQMSEDDIKSKRLALKHGGDQKYDADIALFYTNHEDNQQYRRLICTKNRTGNENLFSLEVTRYNGSTVGIHGRCETVEYKMPQNEILPDASSMVAV